MVLFEAAKVRTFFVTSIKNTNSGNASPPLFCNTLLFHLGAS